MYPGGAEAENQRLKQEEHTVTKKAETSVLNYEKALAKI